MKKTGLILIAVLSFSLRCGAQYAASYLGNYAPGDYRFSNIDDLTACGSVLAGAEVSAARQGSTYVANGAVLSRGGYGFYGGGGTLSLAGCSNAPSPRLLTTLNAAALNIQCRNTTGTPAACGAASVIVGVSLGYSITSMYMCDVAANTQSDYVLPAACDANSAIFKINAKSVASGVKFFDASCFGGLTHDSAEAIHGGWDELSGSGCAGGAFPTQNYYELFFTQELNGAGFTNAQVQFVAMDMEYAGSVLTTPDNQYPNTFCNIKNLGCKFLLTDVNSLAWQNVADDADVMRILKTVEYPNLQMVGLLSHWGGNWGSPTDPRNVSIFQLSPEPYMQFIPYAHREMQQSQEAQVASQTTITTTTFSTTTETINFASGTGPAGLVNGAFIQISGNSDFKSNTPCVGWGTANLAADNVTLTWVSGGPIGHSLTDAQKFDPRWPSGTIIHIKGSAGSFYDNHITSVSADGTTIVLAVNMGLGATSGLPFAVTTCPGLVASNVTSSSFTVSQVVTSAGGSGGIFSVIPDNNVGGLDTNTAAPAFWLANIERTPAPNGDSACSLAQGSTGGQAGNHPTTALVNTPAGAQDVSASNSLCQTIYTNPPQFANSHLYNAGPCNQNGIGSGCILDGTVTTAAIHVQRVTTTGTSAASGTPSWNHAGSTTTSGGAVFTDQGVWLLADAPGPTGSGSGQEWEANQVIQNISGTSIAGVSQYFLSMPWVYSWVCSGGTPC